MTNNSEFVAKSDLKKYLKIIFSHKLILIFSFIVVFSLSILGIFIIKPRYQASVKILIKTPESVGIRDADKIDAVDKNIGPIRSRILSYSYLKKVSDRLGLVKRLREKMATGEYAEASDAILERIIISDLQQGSLMVLGRGEYIFEILAENEDPQLATVMATVAADVFIEESFLDEQTGVNNMFSFLSEQLEKYKSRLLTAEEKLAEYKSKNIIPEEINRRTSNIAAEEARKVSSEMDYKTNSLELEDLHKIVSESDLIILDYYHKNPQIFNSSQISTIEKNMADTQATLDTLLTKYTQNYPAVIEAQKQKRVLQEKLLGEVKNEVQKKINNYQQENERLKIRIKELDEKIENYNEELKSLPTQELEYVRLVRDKQTNENLYQLFLKKTEEIEITKASDQKQMRNPYKIIDPALLPLRPVKPNKKKLLILGAGLGIGAGLMWIFLLEFFNQSLKEVETLAKYCNFPNLGVVPLIKLGKDKKQDLDNFYQRESGYLTEFIRFYKNIEVLGQHQVLLFTSSLKGEGKSLLISCLALTAAKMQKGQVLLIDGDLRSHKLHRLFKIPNDIGLADLLCAQAELEVAIKDTPYPNLKIITAGTQVKMPGELIESPSYLQLIAQLRTKYSYILIDSPPIIPVNDAISFAQGADGVVYTIMAGKTPLEVIERGIKILEQAQVKILGTVVNNPKDALTSAGYGYDYNYSYK